MDPWVELSPQEYWLESTDRDRVTVVMVLCCQIVGQMEQVLQNFVHAAVSSVGLAE